MGNKEHREEEMRRMQNYLLPWKEKVRIHCLGGDESRRRERQRKPGRQISLLLMADSVREKKPDGGHTKKVKPYENPGTSPVQQPNWVRLRASCRSDRKKGGI